MVIVTTFASDDHYTIHHYMYPSFKVVRLTTIVVSIIKFNNHYHVVISNIVNITLFCSDVHYTVFTVWYINIDRVSESLCKSFQGFQVMATFNLRCNSLSQTHSSVYFRLKVV